MPRPTRLTGRRFLGPTVVRDHPQQLWVRRMYHRVACRLHRHGDRGPGDLSAQPGCAARDSRDRE